MKSKNWTTRILMIQKYQKATTNTNHGGGCDEGVLPGRLFQISCLVFDKGEGQTLSLQAIVSKTCLVRDPFLVDFLRTKKIITHQLTHLIIYTCTITYDCMEHSSIKNIMNLCILGIWCMNPKSLFGKLLLTCKME